MQISSMLMFGVLLFSEFLQIGYSCKHSIASSGEDFSRACNSLYAELVLENLLWRCRLAGIGVIQQPLEYAGNIAGKQIMSQVGVINYSLGQGPFRLYQPAACLGMIYGARTSRPGHTSSAISRLRQYK